jgi:D-alanine-D-alanine ligase
MKIAVIMGGTSSERKVSISSGTNIAAALRENGHEVLLLDTVLPISQIDQSLEVRPNHLAHGDQNLLDLLSSTEVRATDFVFNALHGGIGENGIVQGILQTMGYAFNGSRAEGCAIAMDKVITKMIFEKNNIPTPLWMYYDNSNGLDYDKVVNEIRQQFDLPLVIKPGHEGSTIGLTVVRQADQIRPAIDEALRYDRTFLVEEYIPGRELTVSVLGDRALPLVEILPQHGIYDYECKYTKGMSQYEVPAKLEPALTKTLQETTAAAFRLLRCAGYGRMDLRLNPANQPYYLEMNTMPGMTATSLVPKAAKAAGLSFPELLDEIIRLGLKDFAT